MNFSVVIVGGKSQVAAQFLQRWDPVLFNLVHYWNYEGPETFDRIRQFYPENEPVLYLNGDLTRLFIREHDRQLREFSHSLRTLAVDAFRVSHQNRTRLWGVFPRLNPSLMREHVTLDLRHLGPAVWGMWNTADPALNLTMAGAEDVERSLVGYQMFGRILRVNYVAAELGFSGPDTSGTEGAVIDSDAAAALKERFPEWVRCYRAAGGKSRVTLSNPKRGGRRDERTARNTEGTD